MPFLSSLTIKAWPSSRIGGIPAIVSWLEVAGLEAHHRPFFAFLLLCCYCLSSSFFLFLFDSSLTLSSAEEENVPSALAEALPSFVKLGLIMPEGVDALTLNKANVPPAVQSSSVSGIPGIPGRPSCWSSIEQWAWQLHKSLLCVAMGTTSAGLFSKDYFCVFADIRANHHQA